MYAVLTGDVIASREKNTQLWMTALRKILGTMGSAPYDWEIFRGDSFQLVTDPHYALQKSLMIKAALKSMAGADVRIAIGIGTIDYRSQKVPESNGQAFVLSGTCFDELKKQTLAIQTPWQELNELMQMVLPLAMLTVDKWSEKTAEVLLIRWWHPDWSQQQVAEFLQKKAQGNISEALKRGGFDELQLLLNYYQQQINRYVNTNH